ncbi:hypothetical protein GCM10007916_24270 [Psychromonas marina]|uniref:Uncharacterized protein n=1 Tax=Psychromonas marina TaxID=88364 RepID=A0ABQ6E2B9_9GAMM|nr:hypothetical protein GCM10007916_24270 [Psychromonas marina]
MVRYLIDTIGFISVIFVKIFIYVNDFFFVDYGLVPLKKSHRFDQGNYTFCSAILKAWLESINEKNSLK